MSKPKLLVVAFNYPAKDNLYGDVFVHSRLKQYMQYFDIQVLGCNKNLNQDESYEYEGIKVLNVCSKKRFKAYLNETSTDIMAIHFVPAWMFRIIRQYKGPIFVWVHGYEALGWYRRLFNFRLKTTIDFFIYIIQNIRQMSFMHQLINYSNRTGKVKFIFVSKWMRRITEKDTISTVRNYEIIPNPIDETLFSYHKKNSDHRKKVLLIRSFNSKKYANDIAIKAIKILSGESFFEDMEFALYGKGTNFHTLTQEIRKFSNVHLYNTFIENKDIPLIHKEYGVFLCPTRQDAQGVSMCEAMSSGLVPIASNNTAIPEFVTDQETGYLTSSAQEIAETLKKVYNSPNDFLRISETAATAITQKSGNQAVINKEVNMMLSSLKDRK